MPPKSLPDHWKRGSIHRWPGEESIDLYPGLVVSDGTHSRVTGSITVGRSRLPVWAFVGDVIRYGFDSGAADYYDGRDHETFDKDQAAAFFYDLMEHRGEFGRLLLVLADAERCERAGSSRPWYETKRHQKRVGDQLRRCLAALDAQSQVETDEEQAK